MCGGERVLYCPERKGEAVLPPEGFHRKCQHVRGKLQAGPGESGLGEPDLSMAPDGAGLPGLWKGD